MGNEMSKTTQERIENVFDAFVVNKLIEQIEPIKKELIYNKNDSEERTIREYINSIDLSVSEIEGKASAIKKLVIGDKRADSFIHKNLFEYVSVLEANTEKIVESLDDITDDEVGALKTIEDALSFLKEQLTNLQTSIDENVNACIETGKNLNSEILQNRENLKSKVDELAKHYKDETNSIVLKLEKIVDNMQKISESFESQMLSCIDSFEKTMKCEFEKSSNETLQAINNSSVSIEENAFQHVSDLKGYIDIALSKHEEKIIDDNLSSLKKHELMLKILIILSSVNVGGIIVAIILFMLK